MAGFRFDIERGFWEEDNRRTREEAKKKKAVVNQDSHGERGKGVCLFQKVDCCPAGRSSGEVLFTNTRDSKK